MKRANIIFMTLSLLLAITLPGISEASGFRIEAGHTTLLIDPDYTDAETGGFTAGVGYDVNKVLGLDARYHQTEGTISDGRDLKSSGFYCGVDVGYEFNPSPKFTIKPYVSGGMDFISGQVDDHNNNITSVSDKMLTGGAGLRMGFGEDSAITVDLSGRAGEFTDNHNLSLTTLQYDVMVGYRF